jgi:hypothetical protein
MAPNRSLLARFISARSMSFSLRRRIRDGLSAMFFFRVDLAVLTIFQRTKTLTVFPASAGPNKRVKSASGAGENQDKDVNENPSWYIQKCPWHPRPVQCPPQALTNDILPHIIWLEPGTFFAKDASNDAGCSDDAAAFFDILSMVKSKRLVLAKHFLSLTKRSA